MQTPLKSCLIVAVSLNGSLHSICYADKVPRYLWYESLLNSINEKRKIKKLNESFTFNLFARYNPIQLVLLQTSNTHKRRLPLLSFPWLVLAERFMVDENAPKIEALTQGVLLNAK